MKTCISAVTGAGGYVGGAIAETLAARGDTVIIFDVNIDTAKKLAEKINSQGGSAIVMYMDVSDSSSVNEGVSAIVERYGRLDNFINSAGGSAKIAGQNANYCALTDQEDYVIDAVIKINLYGAMYTSRAAAKAMISTATHGHIIHISSAIGVNGYDGKTEYAAAKGGVIAMAKSLAKELGKHNITVNTIAPGTIGNTWVPDEGLYSFGFIKERRGNAIDIANAAEFLSSEKAGFITGQTILVDGGRSLALKGTD